MVAPANPPYILRVNIGGFDCTSIVLDKEEFDENMDTLKEVFCLRFGGPAGEQQLQAIKDAGHLPLCAKGTKTIHLFEKYNIETDKLAMAVRGIGKKILKDLIKP